MSEKNQKPRRMGMTNYGELNEDNTFDEAQEQENAIPNEVLVSLMHQMFGQHFEAYTKKFEDLSNQVSELKELVNKMLEQEE